MDYTKEQLIAQLQLERHPSEGGYFRRTYESNQTLAIENSTRLSMSAIYYMLTDDSPIGILHKNKSDILHCYQLGSPIHYWIISPSGKVTEHIVGPHLNQGHQLQLIVKGGYWKTAQLMQEKQTSHNYSLITEAVTPSFEYEDNTIATTLDILGLSKEWQTKLKAFIHQKQ